MDDACLVSCLSDNLVAKEPAGDLCYYPIATFPLSKDINGTWRVEIAMGLHGRLLRRRNLVVVGSGSLEISE